MQRWGDKESVRGDHTSQLHVHHNPNIHFLHSRGLMGHFLSDLLTSLILCPFSPLSHLHLFLGLAAEFKVYIYIYIYSPTVHIKRFASQQPWRAITTERGRNLFFLSSLSKHLLFQSVCLERALFIVLVWIFVFNYFLSSNRQCNALRVQPNPFSGSGLF